MSHSQINAQGNARKSLWLFYHDLEHYEYSAPGKARDLLENILKEGLDNYTASPDLWHNAAMSAGRVDHEVAQLAIIQAGLREWPDEVDLLCDELQHRYTDHYDLKRAQEIWTKLSSMPREKTGPYWRFWVYGASYHAIVLNDPKRGLELLDEGLKWVRRDGLTNILLAYRGMLVDSIPFEKIESHEQLLDYHRRVLAMLEARYRLGIELGVEKGYVLATALARLYQEQAVAGIGGQSESDDNLSKALACLDWAEQLYTGDPNYPVWGIYEVRARILMAQGKYGDALKVLKSLPEARQKEPSLATMMKLAALIVGEKVEERKREQEVTSEAISAALSFLLQDDGEPLLKIASHSSSVAAVIRHIAQQLESVKHEQV